MYTMYTVLRNMNHRQRSIVLQCTLLTTLTYFQHSNDGRPTRGRSKRIKQKRKLKFLNIKQFRLVRVFNVQQ